ncbi:L-rhamnose mutarotase [Gayadomonas joobiniege]|uniref:L-rhamnose mutarotase n=1 Tax=Gayadomonas joobiniege TaxID=1234606 RepID=UPI00036915CE
MSKRICLALDLVDDKQLIAEYINYHKPENAWPEITQSIKDKGILDMEIYHTGDRLFMIMQVSETFDPENFVPTPEAAAKEAAWESLMWKYQKALPNAKAGEKWVKMEKIYDLKDAVK